MKDGGVQVGGVGAQPGPQGAAQVQQPHFIRMYRDTFTPAQCEEVIRRFEADERRHASTTATRDKPRLRSGCVLRSTSTPAETRMKAKSVPMLVRSASVPMSKMPAGMDTTTAATRVLM